MRRARERFGIHSVTSVIAEVAQRQAQALDGSAQQRADELRRELQLLRIEWRAEYLERLNALRERQVALANEERARMMEEEAAIAVVLAAAAVA